MRRGTGDEADSPLVLVEHRPDLLAAAHGFGSFLFDSRGRLVVEAGQAWLYTTALADGLWESWVRRLDLASLRAGPARRVLRPAPGEDRAVLHHLVAVAPDLIVGFLCDGRGLSAAVAPAPDADFVRDPGFALHPERGWETRGGTPEGWTLEANGAHVICEDTAAALELWLGYDSYRASDRAGDLGWVRVRIDRQTRRVSVLGRHPRNPLAFRPPGWSCARCGGNLASNVTVAGKRAFFHYLRPSPAEIRIGMALSADPLFFDGLERHTIGTVLGVETVVEKFEALRQDGELLLFYECKHADESWRTGLRRYRLRD